MIPNELLYALLGGVLAVFFPRFRLPNFLGNANNASSTDQKALIREVLLEILRNLSQPPKSPDEEIRKTLQAIWNDTRNLSDPR